MKWGSLIIPVSPAIFWISIIVAILLALGTAYLAIRRTNRRQLAWRLIASFAAILSLLAMAWHPQWLSSPQPLTALLITPGAESRALKSFADSVRNISHVFAIGDNEKWKTIFPHLQSIPDAAYLKRHYPEINLLQVAGHGLNDYDWESLDSISIKPDLTPLPCGIKNLQWSRELVVGQTLQIQGSLAGLDKQDAWLYLNDPGGVADSAKITGAAEAHFELSAKPHEIGKYLYELTLKSAHGQTLSAEKLDLVIAPPQPLKILVLVNAPSFETKYLKNWASQQQNVMAVRSTISRERYRFEYLNRSPIALNRITAALLRNFDLVIVDGKTLSALSPTERQALRATVEQEGTGVLLVPDEVIFANEQQNFLQHDFFLLFQFDKFADLDRRLIKPRWPGQQSSDMTAIPTEPFAIKPGWGIQALVEDEMERILAGAYHRGNGLIGLSLIRDSYRWILEGNPQFHAAYWSFLLSALARQDQHKDRWIIPTAKPLIVDQPLGLTVETNAANPVGLMTTESGEQDTIYLQQDTIEPRRWFGTFWPRQTGWHQVALAGGESQWFYVYEKTHWLTWQAAQKIAATQRYAARYANLSAKRFEPIAPRAEPILLFWFFVVFLISCAYLWMERKL